MKTKYWILIFAVLLALAVLAALVLPRIKSGSTANIYRNGKCISSIDLDSVTEGYSFTLEDEDGHINVVKVEPGRIRVSEANCPDKVCVNTGWISGGLKPIVCMPSKLVIRIENKAAEPEFDAVTGEGGA